MTIHSRKTHGLDLTTIRARLAGQSGPRYWRSLEELADTEEFQEFLHGEFPSQAPQWSDPTTRRNFFRLMGASLALAGVSGCSDRTSEKIVPYVRAPEEIVPGKPLYFATAVTQGGHGVGVVVESHMGRPTMLEGNDKHPDSLGAVDPIVQASLLTLYDPDRSQVVMRGREVNTWDAFFVTAVAALDALRPQKGKGLRVLTEPVTSPTLARQLRAMLDEFPEAKWHQYSPAGRDAARAGALLAFGEDVATRRDFEKANVILALDADFLGAGPGHLRAARGFGARREPSSPSGMNRLYAIESTPTITGSMADHRLAVPAHRVVAWAQAVAQELGVRLTPASGAAVPPDKRKWLDALVHDLRKNQGASLVVAGDAQPPIVHALAHAINDALGNVGKTVVHTAPVEARPVDSAASLHELVRDMEAGAVEVLLILGGNPAFTAPGDIKFAEALPKVKLSAHLGLYDDETSRLCGWHLPETHELEAWGDVRATDGTATIQQPLIAPLYGGRSVFEVVAALLRHPTRAGYDIVRDTWQAEKKDLKGEAFEAFWRTSVHDGVVADTKLPPKDVTLKGGPTVPPLPESKGLELVFRPDPTIGDGRHANNGWLQELPKPLTKLTWDNPAQVSPALAERLQLSSGDMVVLSTRDGDLKVPVWVTPGHADESVTLFLGYGRTAAGRVGNGAGFNTYPLRRSDAPGIRTGAEARKTGETYILASTQDHRYVDSTAAEERHLVRVATLEQFREHPDFAQAHDHKPGPDDSLYPEIEGSVSRITDPTIVSRGDTNYAWGMTVNLNTCIGCGACVVACQAENNIPVVGKDQVYRGREMQWIDVDRYYHGDDLDNPETYHQPRLCMHCEKAPCELVCPVAATLHDAEGINNMVYNRCVGTRYCGNNCPYKVRHFNFYQYADLRTPSLALLNNPDVTVRARGVMEKCTYCIQRINEARYTAEAEDRRIRDGEVVTACQASCPTRAIVFGDVNDPTSQVSKVKAEPRNYGLLTELNTRPRTSYVARLRNPNPEIETEPRHGV